MLNGASQVTVCFWINPDGRGEATIGHVFLLDEVGGTASFSIFHGADDTLFISKGAGAMGTGGAWTIPITDGVWNAVCVRLDFSVGNNAPTARVNYKNVTVTQSVGLSGIEGQCLRTVIAWAIGTAGRYLGWPHRAGSSVQHDSFRCQRRSSIEQTGLLHHGPAPVSVDARSERHPRPFRHWFHRGLPLRSPRGAADRRLLRIYLA